MRLLAGSRAHRLNSRQIYLPSQNDAGLAAAAWACEMTALEQTAEAMSDREILWANFDQMLGEMESALTNVADFFGFDSRRAAEIATGPLMGRYSKSLEYEYGANLRRELIAETAERFASDIERALAMLTSGAEKSPLLGRALARAKES
jgi:hypothetical protein